MSHSNILRVTCLLGAVAFSVGNVRDAVGQKAIPIAEVKRTAPVDFEKDVLPIFKKQCLACHNSATKEGKLVLETPQAILKGGDSGPAVVAKDSKNSYLLMLASHESEPIMPPKDNKVNAKPLTSEELGILKLWIDQGATGTVSGKATPLTWMPLPPGVNPIYAVAVTPDGQYAACGRANQVFIYHIPTGQLVGRLTDPALLKSGVYSQPGVAHLDIVQSLAFSPDGYLLASGGYQEVKLWRRPTSVQQFKLPAAGAEVTAVAVSPDKKLLAIGSADKSIKLIDLSNGKTVRDLAGHAGTVAALRFTADSARLISGSHDKSIRVWNLADGALVARIDTPSSVNALTLVGDGTRVAAGGADNLIRVWTLPTVGTRTLTDIPAPVTAIAASPDKKWLAVAGTDGPIKLVDLATGKVARTLAGHGGAVSSLAFNAASNRLVSGGADKIVRVWDPAADQAVASLPENEAAIDRVAINPAGNLVAVAWGEGKVALRKLDDPAPQAIEGLAKKTTGLIFSADGATLFTSGEDGTIRGFQVDNRSQKFSANHASPVYALALSPDGKLLASAGENKELRIWNSSNGSPGAKPQLAGFSGPVRSVCFSLDSLLVIGGSATNEVLVVNVASGTVEQAFAEHAGSVDALAAGGEQSPSIISASADKSVKLWKLVPNKLLAGHTQPVTSLETVAGAPTQIISGSLDGSVRQWNTDNGQSTRQMAHGAPVTSVAVRPDGQRFASAGGNLAKLWNAQNGQLVVDIKGDHRAQAIVASSTKALDKTKALVAARKTELMNAEKDVPTKVEAAKKASEALATAVKAFDEKNEAFKKATEAKVAADKAAADAAAEAKTAADTAAKAKEAADKDKDNKELADAKAAAEKASTDAAAKAKQLADAATAAAKPAMDAEKPAKDAETAKNMAQKAVDEAAAATKKAEELVVSTKALIASAEEDQKKDEAVLEAAKKSATEKELPVRGVAFAADNVMLATSGDDQLVHTWNATDGSPLEVFQGHAGSVGAIAFGAERQLISGANDKSSIVWDLNPAWQYERTIGGIDSGAFADRVIALDFSTDGKQLATGGGEPSRSGELKIWNVADGKLVREFTDAHSDTVFGVDFSFDGKYLASSAADKFVKVFEVATGKFVRSFEGHTHHVLGVSWQENGKVIASCGADNVVKIWNFETGEQQRTIQGFGKQVTSIAFVGDSINTLTSSGDKQVRLHRSDNGQNVRTFAGGTDFMNAAVATPNGKILVGGGSDSVLWIWNGDNGQPIRNIPPPAEASNQQASK